MPTELLGRSDLLRRCAAALAPESGGLLLLAGDAGIGKTALLAELARTSPAARILVGHCVGEGATSLSYVPFVEAFGRLDTEAPEVMDAVVAEYPALARLLPRRVQGEWGSPSAGMAEAVRGALELLARSGPLLVVVEDLHWADDSTRDLLTVLFTRGFSGPVSLVASYRSDDLHRRHPLRSSLVVWSRVRDLVRLEVPALDDDSMGRIVAGVEGRSLPSGVVAGLVRRADGNPFFAQELAAAAVCGAGAEAEDLSRLLLSRVEQLPEDAQEVVRIASVIGRRLRHALLAEAVYDDLLPGERVRHHRACARALSAQPELGSPADLARHAVAAQETGLAYDSSVAAAYHAEKMGGPAEALRHFENALRLRPDEAFVQLTLAAAEAATACGRISRALELLTALRARGDLTGPERARAIGRYLSVVRFTELSIDAVGLVDEALELAAGDEVLRAELLLRRVEALVDSDRRPEALTQAEECLRIADEHDLLDVQFELDTIVARIHAHLGETQESLRRLEERVAGRGDRTDLGVLRALHNIASIHYHGGDLTQALRVYTACAERARRVGLQTAPYALASRALAVGTAYELGEWEEALRLSDHTADTLPEEAAVALDAPRGYVQAARGGREPVLEYERIRRWWENDALYALQSAAACIEAYGFAGDLEAAARVRDEVVEHARALWRRETIAAQVRLDALLLGQLARAGTPPGSGTPAHRALLEQVAVLSADAEAVWGPGSDQPPPDAEGRAWLERARAEAGAARRRLGADVDPAELERAYRAAGELFAERGEPYEAARSRVGAAEVLLAQGRRQEARELLVVAQEVAERLGAQPLLARIDSLQPRGPAPSGLDPSGQGARGCRLGAPTHPAGGRGPRSARAGPKQRRHRQRALHQHQDGQRARLADPGQAGSDEPRGGRRPRARARAHRVTGSTRMPVTVQGSAIGGQPERFSNEASRPRRRAVRCSCSPAGISARSSCSRARRSPIAASTVSAPAGVRRTLTPRRSSASGCRSTKPRRSSRSTRFVIVPLVESVCCTRAPGDSS